MYAYLVSFYYCILGMYGLESYHAERKGEREDMEDAYVMLKDFKSLIKEPHTSM